MDDATRAQAEAFLAAWFDTRRVVQTLNFNRFQQEGLSATQFILLTILGEAGTIAGARPISPSELAARLNVDVTTTTRTADSLAARGLVAKRKDNADRRRSLLSLTEAGFGVHTRMHEAFVAHVVAAFRAMDPQIRIGLVDGLAAFVAAADIQSVRPPR